MRVWLSLFAFAAWETEQQVRFARVDREQLTTDAPMAPPGATDHRKHPVLAQSDGQMLLAWVVAKGWGKRGELRWQVFSSDGRPLKRPGRVRKIPSWSFAAVFAHRAGGFTILY